jgi:CheY-like chemotaxis protein
MTKEIDILFRSFSESERQAFLQLGEPIVFEIGEVVLPAGRSAWDLYIIQLGEVSIWVGNVRLTDLGEGQIIGSSGVLSPQVQWSAVRGNSNGVFLRIRREELLVFFEGYPERLFQQFSVNLFKIWVEVLNQRNGRIAEIQSQSMDARPEQRERRFKLLIVDDEIEIREVMEEIFGVQYDVVLARDGLEAVEQALTESPDLILLDLRLPEMDGYEVCKRLKTHPNTGYIPIVMVTALNATPDKVKGIMHGADEYLTKPVDLDYLIDTVQRTLGKVYG